METWLAVYRWVFSTEAVSASSQILGSNTIGRNCHVFECFNIISLGYRGVNFDFLVKYASDVSIHNSKAQIDNRKLKFYPGKISLNVTF